MPDYVPESREVSLALCALPLCSPFVFSVGPGTSRFDKFSMRVPGRGGTNSLSQHPPLHPKLQLPIPGAIEESKRASGSWNSKKFHIKEDDSPDPG